LPALCATGYAAFWPTANAATITIEFTDRDQSPVAEVVLYAVPAPETAAPLGKPRPRVMNQIGEQFVPHILIAQTGAAIEFPNHDNVNHHVYSFSSAKAFELPLYKGSVYPPVVFNQPGIIVLGCNIHDHMEAHIVVVDTPYFSKSDARGRGEIDGLPPGEYSLHVWTSRLRMQSLPDPRTISVTGDEALRLNVQFQDRLRPAHTSASETLEWSRY
jgi:plastocyanin